MAQLHELYRGDSAIVNRLTLLWPEFSSLASIVSVEELKQFVTRLPRRKLVPGHSYINLVVEEASLTAETICTSGHKLRMTVVIIIFGLLFTLIRSKT